jgi:F0F1-type ATP synthase membrane subunit c/vacuolar-type H+-ATPase subunit K
MNLMIASKILASNRIKDASRRKTRRLFFTGPAALALVSAVAIFAPKRWPKTARPLALATLILAIASLGAGVYIAQAGGKIRHREFRNTPPPKTVEAESG